MKEINSQPSSVPVARERTDEELVQAYKDYGGSNSLNPYYDDYYRITVESPTSPHEASPKVEDYEKAGGTQTEDYAGDIAKNFTKDFCYNTPRIKPESGIVFHDRLLKEVKSLVSSILLQKEEEVRKEERNKVLDIVQSEVEKKDKEHRSHEIDKIYFEIDDISTIINNLRVK